MPAARAPSPGGPRSAAEQALPRTFFARPVLDVARDCIGRLLVHRTPQGTAAGIVVEAEAYRGPEDRAAHSYAGRRTARTEVMFGAAGYAYVFRVYGLHWHFNVVTGAPGEPEAVLIRAVEPRDGLELMARRRGISPGGRDRDLASGPGKLCQAFAIDRAQYGHDLCGSDALFLAEGEGERARRVARTARIGVDYAGSWAARKFRFYDPTSPHVSRARPRTPRSCMTTRPDRTASPER